MLCVMDFENIRKNIFFDITVIFLIFAGCFIFGFDEVTLLLKYDDIGSIIMAFGIVWLFGAFGKLVCVPIECTVSSMMCAVTTIIFGYGVFAYGFFMGICLAGVAIFIMGIYTTPVINEGGCLISRVLIVILAIPLIIIGFSFKGCSEPTKRILPYARDVSFPTAKWQIVIVYKDNAVGTRTKISTTQGTEASATIVAQNRRKAFRKANPRTVIYQTKLLCIWIPEWYERKYGWPDKGSDYSVF